MRTGQRASGSRSSSTPLRYSKKMLDMQPILLQIIPSGLRGKRSIKGWAIVMDGLEPFTVRGHRQRHSGTGLPFGGQGLHTGLPR